MGALMAAIWPSIEASMDEIAAEYPAGLKDAFGIGQLDSVETYIDAEMLSIIVPLALAIFAVRCISKSTVGAEDRGHLDTLLSLPVSRRVLVAASFVVTGLVLAMILALIWALTWIAGAAAVRGISAATLAAGMANVWPLAMAFAGFAVFVAGLTHRPGDRRLRRRRDGRRDVRRRPRRQALRRPPSRSACSRHLRSTARRSRTG